MLTEARQQQVIAFCRELIKIPSVSGCEGDVARLIVKTMQELGFEAEVDRWGNAVGRLAASSGNPTGAPILFDGHIDTIGVTGTWEHNAFGADIENGRIYGRGASDMKGSIAAMAMGAAFAAQDGKLQRDVWVSGTVDEEVVEGLSLAKVMDKAQPGWVVIGEATDLHLVIGQRGRARLVLEAQGVPAHSSTPELGVNAAKKMANVVLEIEKLDRTYQDFLGEGTLELVELVSMPYPSTSVVPSGCRAQYDRRLLLDETAQSIAEPIQRLLDEMAASDPALKVELEMPVTTYTTHTGEEISDLEFSPAWVIEKDHPLVKSAAEALSRAGIEIVYGKYNFCTNGSYSAAIAEVPTIGFGPGKETLAHIIDEYIDIEDLLKAAEGYYELAAMG